MTVQITVQTQFYLDFDISTENSAELSVTCASFLYRLLATNAGTDSQMCYSDPSAQTLLRQSTRKTAKKAHNGKAGHLELVQSILQKLKNRTILQMVA